MHAIQVPTDYSVEEAYKCARLCGLNIISQVKAACGGDLRKVKRVVKLVGFVNCQPDFYDIPKVGTPCYLSSTASYGSLLLDHSIIVFIKACIS
jgi:hypothetical protein